MLHRLMLNLLLIVSFGFGQMSAFTHEFSHYTDAVTANQSQDLNENRNIASQDKPSQHKQAPHNQVCEKCVTYAELGNIISNSHAAFTVTAMANLSITSSLQTTSFTKPRTYSARAPPTLA